MVVRRAFPTLGRMLALCVLLEARAGGAGSPAPGLTWGEAIGSPHPPVAVRAAGGDLSTVCPDSDIALRMVASQLAARTLPADDAEAITYALRAAGDPHVWPRAFLLEGKAIDLEDAKKRMRAWLGTFPKSARLRCGIVTERGDGKEVIAAVAIDAQADLTPMPVRARPSSWVEIDAKVLSPATGAKVIVLGPTGAPRSLLTSFSDGRVKARANVDRPGTWLFQVLVDGVSGPRPVLETYVFVGVEPPAEKPHQSAPGEEAGGEGDSASALTRMMMMARRSESLPGLVRDMALDRVAKKHAERMMRAKQIGHDVGDGDPKERLERAGISLSQVGENVAHAANVVLAHRALWSSPSHRDNLLQPRFDRVGVGVTADSDGSVWVTQIFATTSPELPPSRR